MNSFLFAKHYTEFAHKISVGESIAKISLSGSNLNFNACQLINSCFYLHSKRTVSNREFIQTICDVLRDSNVLSSKCAIDLIKLIEELARYSISPIELKSLFYLLREKENFDYRKQLLQVCKLLLIPM